VISRESVALKIIRPAIASNPRVLALGATVSCTAFGEGAGAEMAAVPTLGTLSLMITAALLAIAGVLFTRI
jgi:hypothetical protein